MFYRCNFLHLVIPLGLRHSIKHFMSRVTIEVTPEQHQHIKAMAAIQGKSIKEFVLERLFSAEGNEDLQAWQDLKDLLRDRSIPGRKGSSARRIDSSARRISSSARRIDSSACRISSSARPICFISVFTQCCEGSGNSFQTGDWH